uniref:EF-hand calcium binding domain 13 n=1 Tax=Nomascus leucogenys TaxID=61853 RepID=A0A2I3GXV2_NOMLE
METKVHLFCQAEENIDLVDDGSSSFATDLPSGAINHKKYIKFSKTIEKKISPEIRSLSPEYKQIFETSIILCGEEKSSDFSGEKKVGRKSLQVQQHSKRTEIIPPFLKLSKEKMTRKENSLCKLPNQYSVHKTSSPLCTSSAITREKEMLSNLYMTLDDEVTHGYLHSKELSGNHMVDIGDIIFILNELQEQYEDVSITEGSPLDEITSDRKLSSIAECYLKYKKKNSLSSKLPEPSISKKLNKNSNQYYSKIMENDDLESKRPKNTWQIRKFLGGVGSSNVEVQEPYSKNGINFKKHSEKGEIHDSKSKPQSLKSSTSLSKSLDKSDISSIPKLQKPAVRKRSSLLKQVSSTEKTAINTLVLPGVIKAIDKIKDKNVDYEDLNTCLQNLGIYLSKPECKKITELTEASEIKKVNFKEFINTMMSNTECFSEKLLLPDAIETLDNLRKETMSVSDLWNTLSSLNSNLKKDEFLAALKLVAVDEGDKVQFEEFAKVVRKMRDAARLEELQEVVLAADLLEGDMIAGKNLEDFLRNIGIKSPKEEVEKILQSDFVSEDNMVNIKDYMRALRDTQKFSNYIDFGKEASNLKLPKVNEIKEAANILSHVDNGKIGIPDLEHALKCLNVNLTEEDFNEALNCCNVSDNMEVDLKDFLMKMKESPHFQKSK